mgnify:CR=1 FL=1
MYTCARRRAAKSEPELAPPRDVLQAAFDRDPKGTIVFREEDVRKLSLAAYDFERNNPGFHIQAERDGPGRPWTVIFIPTNGSRRRF